MLEGDMRLFVCSACVLGLLAVWGGAPAGAAPASSLDPSAVLAEWNDGSITVRDFVDWWKDMPAGERDTLDTVAAKRDFLDNMINAEIMLAEAETLGIYKQADLQEFLLSRDFGIVSEALLNKAMASAPPVTDSEVDEVYGEQMTQVTVWRIMTDTRDEILAIADSLAAGVPFEDLAQRYSTDVTGENGGYMGAFRRINLEQPWQDEIFRLKAGETSEPFYTDKGWAIVRVETKAEIEPQDPEGTRRGIRSNLERQRMFSEQAAYLDSLRVAYDVEINTDAVVGLCSQYTIALARLGDRTTVVSQDVVPDFTGDEADRVVASFDDWTYTAGDVVNTIISQPYPTRPVLDDADAMFDFIARQVKDSLIVYEAGKLGVRRWPDVQREIEKTERRRVATRVYRTLTDKVAVPEDSIRAYYEAHKEYFIMPAGNNISKIIAPSRAAADSFLVRLEAGESFEDIARTRSLDPFTAPQGGKAGFLREGNDPEFDSFLQDMKVGDTKYFRSLEGHVILRLDKRHERRQATYDEARPTIEKELARVYRDKMLADWLKAERARRNIKVHEEGLESISLVP
jgi:parvulin-like peptidyl-prolyl isomerase